MHPMEDASSVERMLLDKAYKAKVPVNATIELTPLCNMSCKMCYVHLNPEEVKKQGGLRSVSEWLQIAEEMKRAGVLFVLLTGGEPLSYPGFKELYTKMHKMGLILTINTNGTLLNEEWADFFAHLKPRRINITLYGNEDTYSTLCQYPTGHAKVLKAFHLLKERSIDVRISGSITKLNEENLQYLYDTGEKFGFPVRVDTYIMPDVREKSKSCAMSTRMSPEDAAKAHLFCLERSMGFNFYKQYVENTVEILNQGIITEKKDTFSCLAGNCSFTINWQGMIRPCVILHTPSISVFEHGFQNAWDLLKTECQNVHINPKCTICSLRELCRTCPACALLETGSYAGIPDYMCRYTEEIHRLLNRRYKELHK